MGIQAQHLMSESSQLIEPTSTGFQASCEQCAVRCSMLQLYAGNDTMTYEESRYAVRPCVKKVHHVWLRFGAGELRRVLHGTASQGRQPISERAACNSTNHPQPALGSPQMGDGRGALARFHTDHRVVTVIVTIGNNGTRHACAFNAGL